MKRTDALVEQAYALRLSGLTYRQIAENLSCPVHFAYTLSKYKERTMRAKSMLNVSEIEFTERQSEVLFHLMKGLSNQQIADKLFVCQKTVKFHLTAMYQIANVKSRTQLIVVGAHWREAKNGLSKTCA